MAQQRLQSLNFVATSADLVEIDLLLLLEVQTVFARQRVDAVVVLLDQLREADAALFAERLIDLVVGLHQRLGRDLLRRRSWTRFRAGRFGLRAVRRIVDAGHAEERGLAAGIGFRQLQTQTIAPGRALNHSNRIGLALAFRLPQVHRVPRHRALQRVTRGGSGRNRCRGQDPVTNEMAQRNAEARIGMAVLIDAQHERDETSHRESGADDDIGATYVTRGKFLQRGGLVQQCLELGVMHLDRDVVTFEEEHRFGERILLTHPEYPLRRRYKRGTRKRKARRGVSGITADSPPRYRGQGHWVSAMTIKFRWNAVTFPARRRSRERGAEGPMRRDRRFRRVPCREA